MIHNKSIAVSIIIPVYNVEKYLGNCLESLTQQTLNNIEIILINDCSTDNSEAIILTYKEKDSRIVYLKQETNQGQGYARNYGIKEAKGEYILFVDSDDYIKTNATESLYSKAKELNLDVLEADFYRVFPDKTLEQKNAPLEKVLSGEDYFETIPYTVGVIWNKLWRTQFLRDHNLYFVKEIFEDVIYLSEAMKYAKRVYRLDYAFYYYIIRDNSTMTSEVSKKHLICQMKLIERLETSHHEAQGRSGNNQRLKLLLYAFSGLANYIVNFKPSNEEIEIKREAKKFLNKKIKAFRPKIFGCTKLGTVQKTLLYISPYLMSFVLRKIK